MSPSGTFPGRISGSRPKAPSDTELVEVVDISDRPILVMPLNEAHRQRLYHRSVIVLVYDADGKLYLQRRSRSKALFPGKWDLSVTGHVQAMESREEAALRELSEELSLTVGSIWELERVPASVETSWEFVTLFSVGRQRQSPRPSPAEIDEGYFFDPEELACLVRDFRDLLTPALVHCHERGLLFSNAPPLTDRS